MSRYHRMYTVYLVNLDIFKNKKFNKVKHEHFKIEVIMMRNL